MVLNSPFFDLNASDFERGFLTKLVGQGRPVRAADHRVQAAVAVRQSAAHQQRR